MIKIKLIIRRLIKQRLSTFFTLLSFSIAFCCIALVYLFVSDELAFDKYHSKFDDIHRLNIKSREMGIINCSFPGVLYDELETVSGITNFARLQVSSDERNIFINNTPFVETSILFGDPEILKIFDFEFIAGNPLDALNAPLSIIITETIAEKYFKSQNVLGKTIHFDRHDFTITGVVKDIPSQSHFTMNMMASVSSYKKLNNNLLTKWYMTAFNYYFLIPGEADKKSVEKQLVDVFGNGHGMPEKERKFEMYLEPLGDIHLKSVGTRWDNAIKGDIKVVFGLIVIALLVLGIAITNYINSLTAVYRKKVKEIGIRKINGASKTIVAYEQALETLILFLVSMCLGLVLASIILPFANSLVDKSLQLNLSLFVWMFAFLFSSTLISLLYPILFFNSFNLSDAVKSQAGILKLRSKKQQQRVRGSFVTFQLGIVTFLIVATLVINKQLQLVLSTKLGFNKENTLIVKNPYGKNMNKTYDLFKEELLKIPMVNTVGVAQNVPGGFINNYSPARLPEQKKEDASNIAQITVDHDFLSAVGASFIAGRNFDKNLKSDKKNKIVINQSAVELFNLTDPIGQTLAGINNAGTENGELEVIGVIEDMQYFTLKEKAKPVMYYIRDWGKHNIVVRLQPGDYSATISSIKSVWANIAPELPFSMQFMDDKISSNYKAEINVAKIISILSGIAIFLSALGILGMIAFTIQHRIKEIGIRKVNGAKVSEILTLLNRDFIKWVAIAFVIACPIAYYAMNKWLENFAYKTTLSWWIFALAGVLALGIALLTVSWQSWRAATRNPVEALRYE